MKGIASIFFVAILISCQEPEAVSEFTGNEITYELVAGSEYNVNGTISFKERVDGFTNVIIQLKGTDGKAQHPVHLHLGTISTPKADVAALLSPVSAATGKSETLLDKLADDTPILYRDISNLEACIKIHLADSGAGRDVILAGGNIGESYVKALSDGRSAGFAVCKSK
ncbi:MAG TPA: hypothetical protein VK508_07995 [Cyclobacteriaceae bacterium]|nr:hypothetical protein [Cyclobacteriaceae bacterium]